MLFWGYFMILDPYCFKSVKAIISCVQTFLQNLLKQKGFDVFHEKSKLMCFHIHDYTYESLCMLNLY